MAIGHDPRKEINKWSDEFKSSFLTQLRISHGTKPISANKFYNEFISNKEHVHMNSTRWHSLTDFVKYLGREGICRVEEDDKGVLCIAWIDSSPEALRRQEALKRKERQDKGDEEREQAQIQAQIEKARADALAEVEEDATLKSLQRPEGEKITLNFGAKPTAADVAKPMSPPASSPSSEEDKARNVKEDGPTAVPTNPPALTDAVAATASKPAAIKMSFGSSAPKPKNVFASAGKKNPLAAKKAFVPEPQKKMSEAERIMKEELEQKRARETAGFRNGAKRQRVA